MFGNSETRAIKKALFKSKPHTPSHEAIELPPRDDALWRMANGEELTWIHDRCAHYHDWVHQFCVRHDLNHIGPWRLERRSKIDLMMVGYEEPTIGIRYRLFYNACPIGSIEIEPLTNDSFLASDDHKPCAIHIEISHAHFLPHDHVEGFLHVAAVNLDTDRARLDRQPLNQAIVASMLKCLWDAKRNDWAELRFSYYGAIAGDYQFRGRGLAAAGA